MLFVSSQKLFPLLRYLHFCFDFLVMQKSGLITKLKLITKFMTSQTGQQITKINIFPNISRGKGNQAMKFGQIIKYSTLVLWRTIQHLKHLSSNIFWQTSTRAYNRNKFKLLIRKYAQFWFFVKGCGTCFSNFSCYILLTDHISLAGYLYFLRYWAICVL